MREHRTIQMPDRNAFDSEVNTLVSSEGWEVDSKNYSQGRTIDHHDTFTAFLSREVPSSPPTTENRESQRMYTYDEMWLSFQHGVSCEGSGRGLSTDISKIEEREQGYFNDFLESLGKNPPAHETKASGGLTEEINRLRCHLERIETNITDNPRADAHLGMVCLYNIEFHMKSGEKTPAERPSNDQIRKSSGMAFEYAYKLAQRHAEESKSYPVGDLFRPWWEGHSKGLEGGESHG